MTPATLAGLGALLGPVLVFATWALSRRERGKASDVSALAATVTAANATTATMQALLVPLEREINELRNEIKIMRAHIQALELQVRQLGHEPLPPPGRGE